MKLGLSAFMTVLALLVAPVSNAADHDFAKWLVELRLEAKERGISDRILDAALGNAAPIKRVIELDRRQPEFTMTFDEYLGKIASPTRARIAAKMLVEHDEILTKASKKYGVAPEIIVAIIGVETSYGRNKGSYRVIDALTTLSFDYPKRSKFFKKQLKSFFLLCEEQKQDPLSLKGSYAGAMGYGQFISSSYRAYAVDYDGDGYADLFNSVDDAIGSVANYLYIHGWKKDGEIVTATYPNNVRKIFEPRGSVSKFIPLSFKEGDNELFFIGDDNFIAITKYNISHFYAMAVYYLSEELKK